MLSPDLIKLFENNSEIIETLGVYSCLVTHSSYGKSTKDHKIERVRHILFRILTKLDQTNDTGLPRDFGSPRVGTKWKEVLPVVGLSGETDWEDLYGWPRHEDELIRKMVDVWAKGQAVNPGGTNSGIIDPITLF